MVAEHVAVQVHNVAAMLLREVRLLEKAAVVVVRHETNLHALFLVGGLEIAVARDLARVALGFFAEREQGARELVLPQREEKIALVLAHIASALEQHAAIVAPFEPREMPGGDELRAELVRAVNEPAELQILVAHHARIRRTASLVFVGEILDDLGLKLLRFVNEVIRNAERVADRAGIGDGLRPAALVLGARHAILRPELERDAHHLVALFEQQRRRRGGIHSSAHADDDARSLFRCHKADSIAGAWRV